LQIWNTASGGLQAGFSMIGGLIIFTWPHYLRPMERSEAMRNMDARMAAMRRNRNREEFKTFDRVQLVKMDDKALAEWQSKYSEREPQWRLAEHEWQRRLLDQQLNATIKSARWQAWFGIMAAIIGAILGAILTTIAR
jgi:hypothetical protein